MNRASSLRRRVLNVAHTSQKPSTSTLIPSTLWGSQSWLQPALSRLFSYRTRRFLPQETVPPGIVCRSCERDTFHNPQGKISRLIWQARCAATTVRGAALAGVY
jgi:hypothetical protein